MNIIVKTTVCEIEHYAIHDGPGIRTVIFLKGCPLRCLWCSNPETQRKENELYYNEDTCILCERCIHACKVNALKTYGTGIIVDREKCNSCGNCVNVCPTSSLKLVGTEMTTQEVFEEISKDLLFYRQSGGGVTISGGESLMHIDFILELLKVCKEEYIHTALETTGFGNFENIEEVAKYADLFLFDIKHCDPAIHKEITGVDNSLILKNLTKLSMQGKEIILRMPLIPGINDSKENIINTIKIAEENNIRELHILPYHTLGLDKYKRLQMNYKLPILTKHESSYLEILKRQVEAAGIKCIIGG